MRDGTFSHRIGRAQPQNAIQYESIDPRLSNRLWDCVDTFLAESSAVFSWEQVDSDSRDLAIQIHTEFFGNTRDTTPDTPHDYMISLKNSFKNFSWNRKYDLLEFTLRYFDRDDIERYVNEILERECSGYRSVNYRIVAITSAAEIESLQVSLASPAGGVSGHISAAIASYSDKNSPDYRNVVRESIHAVESAAKFVSGMPKATLGDALKRIDKLHPALGKAYSSLYGWTNDSDGIRHAMLEDNSEINADLAKYMLVSCSAFANYLVSFGPPI